LFSAWRGKISRSIGLISTPCNIALVDVFIDPKFELLFLLVSSETNASPLVEFGIGNVVNIKELIALFAYLWGEIM